MQGRALTDSETQQMRARLTATALELVDRGGRDACSLRGVAAAAGMSRTTPYTYFEDKEALLDAVRVAAVHQLADACEAALAEGRDVSERLRGVGRAYVAFALDHPTLYDLIFEPGAPSEAQRAATARYRELASAPLREAHALGITTMEPDRLSHVLWAGTHGLLALHRGGKLRHGLTFDEVLQDLGDTLAFGFVRREAP